MKTLMNVLAATGGLFLLVGGVLITPIVLMLQIILGPFIILFGFAICAASVVALLERWGRK